MRACVRTIAPERPGIPRIVEKAPQSWIDIPASIGLDVVARFFQGPSHLLPMNDIAHILIGEDNTWIYLVECVLRTVAMFVVVLLLFKLTGKKEVRQFSVLELIVIIGLGSAVGDPMLHSDAPLLPALVSITVVLVLYRMVNVWTNRSVRFSAMVQGEVVTVFSQGRVDPKALDREGLSVEEFFGDLRVQHVEHLGQVKSAHMEVDGELSVFFHAPEDVSWGLPIHPGAERGTAPSGEAPMCCGRCGSLVEQPSIPASCAYCGHTRWSSTVRFPRVG
jgi:uncharacterized membrane protein YcaP (DUF421 family)